MDAPTNAPPVRRPLKSRETRWAAAAARALADSGVTPNAISVASIGFAAAAAVALAGSGAVAAPGARAAVLVASAVCVQLRLLCNLLDGMVAIEGGKKTRSGELFNDVPDRIADPLILVAAGLAPSAVPGAVHLGWAAGLLAVGTAYVRVLGSSLGTVPYFLGPMAKPHRMAAVTAGCLAAAAEAMLGLAPRALAVVLAAVVAGALVTAARRLARIAADLEAR